jgi:parvulin-like peptidyl-prolyl isomerase
MRPVLGIVSLLVVLAVVSFVAKKQPGGATGTVDATTSGATTQRQAQQIQQQIKATVEGVMQQPRPMPADE